MKTLSESIRALRRARGFTQEALSERLGVTPQTISKWESGTSLPDVSMILPLASIFGVSTDVIFGVTPDSEEKEIEDARKFEKLEGTTNEQAASRWLAVLKRYPNNYTARLELASAYHCMATEEDYSLAIEQYERILDECIDVDIRSDAIDALIHCYSAVGKVEEAIRTSKKAPTIRACRDFLMAQIDGSPTQREDIQKLLNFNVSETAWYLTNQRYETVEEKIHACEAALTVLDAVYYDGHSEKNAHWNYRDAYIDLACAFAQTERREEMYANLDLAFEETAASEALPLGIYSYTGNKFVTAATYNHDVASNGSDWVYFAYRLTSPRFDTVRGEERFCEFDRKVRALVKENGCTEMLEQWLAE